MFDSNDFVKLIKQVSVDAVNASKPSNMVFGKVISVSPLQIKVDQKLILNTAQLVLSRNVTEHWIEMTVDHMTEAVSGGSGVAAYESHSHPYKGRKRFLVHNQLTIGEEVILCQVSGGQKYIVIDRIGKG